MFKLVAARAPELGFDLVRVENDAHVAAWVEYKLEQQATLRQCLEEAGLWGRLRLMTHLHCKFEQRFHHYVGV